MKIRIMRIITVLIVWMLVGFSSLANEYPRRYDLRELDRVTSVKNQGSIGSCWAVASLGALESTLKTQEGIDYDLSENNMITQLSSKYVEGAVRAPEYGGDDAIAAAYLTSWRGPVLESQDPYPQSKTPTGIVVRTGLKPIKHVQEILFLPDRKNALDNQYYKEHIMKYGAISMAMWKGTPSTFGRYYSQDNFAWYYPDQKTNKEGNGHAVNIVGWDDDYPKENFSIIPPGDGAFIVKNTKGPEWGQADFEKNMGGYFYISYYDGMLGDKLDSNIGNSVITRVDEIDNFDHIYQYDELGYTKALSSTKKTAWFANSFRIDSMKSEALAGVSFYTLQPDVQYEIWVAKDVQDIPNSKKAKMIQSGRISLPGYHTIDTFKEMLITEEKLTVAVKLISDDRRLDIAIESPEGVMSAGVTNKAGTSFVMKSSNQWDDLNKLEKNANVCLKIFTNDVINHQELLTVGMMKKEVDFALEWIKTHQPVAKVEGYTAKQKAIIEEVKSGISQPLSEEDFYLQINQLFAMMGDGHTKLYEPKLDTKYLNIPFKWLEEGLVVTKNMGDLMIGDKIISIGGKTAGELNKLLYKQIASENDYWVRVKAPHYLNKEIYLDFFNLMNQDETVDVVVKRGKMSFVLKKKLSHRFMGNEFSQKPWVNWHIEEENDLGYFNFNSFPTGDELLELQDAMDDFFEAAKHKNIHNIAIDIRENDGGTAQGLNYLLSYIPTGKIYIEGNKEYRAASQYEKKPQDMLFNGKIYLMTSNETFSCAVLATTILHDNGLVTVIGEPTGEKPAFNRHGSSSDGKLPGLNWEFMMTSYRPIRPLDFDVNEVANFPDILINTQRSDIITGRDRQMDELRDITRGDDGNRPATDKEMTITLNDQYITLKQGKKFTVNEKTITINDGLKGLGKNHIWIEDTRERNKMICKTKLKGKGIDIIIPEALTEKKTYVLHIKDNQGYVYRIIIRKVDNVRYATNVLSKRYNTKFNYFLIKFKKDVKKGYKNKVAVYDESNKKIIIRTAEKTVDDPLLLIQPSRSLEQGKVYVIKLKPGAIQYVDDSKNEEELIIKVLVKE